MTDSFKPLIDATRQALADDAGKAEATFEVTTKQIDGLRSTAQLRQHTLTVDEPEALGGQDTGPNPVELVLAALGTCQEITYRLYADALGIPLNGISVKLAGDLDLRGFFGVNDDIRAGYTDIRATVEIDSPANDTDLTRLKAAVDAHCPVLDILNRPTPVTVSLERTVQSAAA